MNAIETNIVIFSYDDNFLIGNLYSIIHIFVQPARTSLPIVEDMPQNGIVKRIPWFENVAGNLVRELQLRVSINYVIKSFKKSDFLYNFILLCSILTI